METWTTGDRYGNFSSNPYGTLLLFRTYVDFYVQESYDAAILLTWVINYREFTLLIRYSMCIISTLWGSLVHIAGWHFMKPHPLNSSVRELNG